MGEQKPTLRSIIDNDARVHVGDYEQSTLYNTSVNEIKQDFDVGTDTCKTSPSGHVSIMENIGFYAGHIQLCRECYSFIGISEHNMVDKGVGKEPTCIEAGYRISECSICRYTRYPGIPITDHIPVSANNGVAATCTTAGKESDTICKTCQKPLGTGKEIPATGRHTYGQWNTKQATVLAAGYKVRYCSKCNAAEKIVLNKLPAKVTLNAKSVPLQLKKSTTAIKISSYTKGDSVAKWSSSNGKILTVNAKTGKVTAKKTGTAYVIVTMKSGATAKCKVKVQKKAVKTTKITVNKSKVTLVLTGKKKVKTFTVKAVKNPITSPDKVTFKSSNKKVATVSSKGKITAKKKGTATITVKAGKKTKKIKVTVKTK